MQIQFLLADIDRDTGRCISRNRQIFGRFRKPPKLCLPLRGEFWPLFFALYRMNHSGGSSNNGSHECHSSFPTILLNQECNRFITDSLSRLAAF
jgi:hypothetical protein